MTEVATQHLQPPAEAGVPAPSPFLPGTYIQYAWDSTSLGYLKTCPQLYKYIMIDGWAERDTSIHLRFGQEFHQAMQDYDMLMAEEDAEHDDVLHTVVTDLLRRTGDFAPDPLTKAGKYKSRPNLIRAVIWHLEQHKDDVAQTYILANGKPAVELSFRFELDWGPGGQTAKPYMLSGHLDRVVDFNGELFVEDYKTTTSTPGQFYFNQFAPNNQMSLYALASQIVIGSPVKGVMINAVQLLVEGTRSVRGFTYRTQDLLDEWTADLRMWLTLAETYAVRKHWPKNDTACDKFGGCRFREVCSKSPRVREQFLKADFIKLEEANKWNPLKPR